MDYSAIRVGPYPVIPLSTNRLQLTRRHGGRRGGGEPQHGHAVRKAVPGGPPGRGSGGRSRPWCEHKRTLARRMGAGRVRLCTQGARACAKSDTRLVVSHRFCPFVHTVECPVCTSGHDVGRGAWEPPRARGQRPAGPRGRPKRSLRADKGCPSSRFSAGLTRRGAPRIAGRRARASRGESAPRPAEECRTFSEAGTWRRRSGGRA